METRVDFVQKVFKKNFESFIPFAFSNYMDKIVDRPHIYPALRLPRSNPLSRFV
jgi:hypothetical protein